MRYTAYYLRLLLLLRQEHIAAELHAALGIDLSQLLYIPWWGAPVTLVIAAIFCLVGSIAPAISAARRPVNDSLRQLG